MTPGRSEALRLLSLSEPDLKVTLHMAQALIKTTLSESSCSEQGKDHAFLFRQVTLKNHGRCYEIDSRKNFHSCETDIRQAEQTVTF